MRVLEGVVRRRSDGWQEERKGWEGEAGRVGRGRIRGTQSRDGVEGVSLVGVESYCMALRWGAMGAMAA